MEPRRLVKAGSATHTVSLPKTWVERYKLQKGDTVYVGENPGGDLLISATHKATPVEEAKEISIPLDGKALDSLQREITSAYLNNYRTIHIIGETLGENAARVREMLHSFVALEVAEQTDKRITAKDFLDLKEIDVGKTLRRIDMIVRSMLQDSRATLAGSPPESLAVRDEDVNRQYFLLTRLLRSALRHPPTAEFFKMRNDKILSTWYMTVNLENIADDIKNMSALCKTLKGDEVKKANDAYAAVEQAYLDALKAYFTQDKALADTVGKRRLSIMGLAAMLPPGPAEALKAMVSNINNIARIVIDDE